MDCHVHWNLRFVLLACLAVYAYSTGLCRRKVDVVFVIDGSSSVKANNFQKVIEFVKDVIQSFEIGNDAAFIGTMQYSETSVAESYLHGTRDKVLADLTKIQYQSGRYTYTGAALKFAREVMYSEGHGARRGVPKVLFVITDGSSSISFNMRTEALLNHLAGITTFAVGVADAVQSELVYIGSKPSTSHVFHVDTFVDLDGLGSIVTRKACPVKKPCRCWVNGDPHYHTCDGVAYDYMGRCTYVLAKTCGHGDLPDFEIHTSNEMCNRGTIRRPITCTKTVFVSVYGMDVEMSKNGQIWVDHQIITPPFSREFESGRFFTIVVSSGKAATLNTDFGLKITYKGMHVDVNIPSDYENKLCGLCGNYNGNPKDDAITKYGSDVGKNVNFDRRSERNKAFKTVGDSWLVPKRGADDLTCTSDAKPDSCPTPRWILARAVCLVLNDQKGVFGNCLRGFDGVNGYEDCVFDVCRGQNKCENIESFAEECRSLGLLPDDWRRRTNCPLPCGKDSNYNPRMTACPATCAQPNPSECPYPDEEGCECKRGFLLEGGVCINANKCGCSYSDGTYHKHGEVWLSNDCNYIRECKDKTVCEGAYSCSEGKTCGVKDGKVGCY